MAGRLFFAALTLGGFVGLLLAQEQPVAPKTVSSEAYGQVVVGKRLGLLPETGKPKLKIHWKLNTPPASPPSVDHFSGWTFNMGGNDRYGSCGPTSAANHLGMNRKYLLGLDKPVPLAQVLDLYRRSSSPPFNPQTGANDNGVVMSDLLSAMVSDSGLDGDKVLAFSSFADRSDASIQAAINEFGGVLFAVDLQTAQQAQTDAGYWDYKRSGSWGGHAILAGKYDKASGRINVVTWQKDVYTTAAFRKYQLSEVWMPVWKSAVDSGKFFSAIDGQQFVDDYKALTGQDFPVKPTPPTPPTPPVPPIPPTPPVPPTPGKAFTGTETTTWVNGSRIGPTVSVQSTLPAIEPGKPYTIDLSKYNLIARLRLKHRIVNAVDHDSITITDNGDSLTISPKAQVGEDGKVGAIDWAGFLTFLTGLLPLIEAILRIFGGLIVFLLLNGVDPGFIAFLMTVLQ